MEKEFEVKQHIFTYVIVAKKIGYNNHSGSMWDISIKNKKEYPSHGISNDYFLIRVNNIAEVNRFVNLTQKMLKYTPSPNTINEVLTLEWLFYTLKSSKICQYGHKI